MVSPDVIKKLPAHQVQSAKISGSPLGSNGQKEIVVVNLRKEQGETNSVVKAAFMEELEREDNLQTENLAHLVTTPEIKPIMDSLLERDYDTEPTELYSALQKKKWSDAISILEKSPEEARTWVYRKEPQKQKIRWRLLPIHGAVIFQAPPEVVESILLIFPEGAAERDDEGSLPIHLAYKRASGASVCKLLLDAFPTSVDVTDRKGRTPKHLAANSTGPKHREFVYAMKNHLLALRAARVSARAEERAKYNTKLEAFKQEHEEEIAVIEKKKANEIALLEKKIEELEDELRRTEGASKKLVDNIAWMEEKLAKQEENEKRLHEKIGALEHGLDESARNRRDEDAKMKQEVMNLNEQLTSIQEHVNQLLVEKDVLNKSLDEVVAGAELEKKALEESNAEKEARITKLLQEAEVTRQETYSLKTEIEGRIANEARLSKQINELEIQLQEQRESSSVAAEKAKARLDELEKERLDLRKTVGALTHKLQTVAGFLDDMSNEQVAIIEQADVHEAEMQAATKEHARILEQVSKQQELDAKAQESREAIMKMIRYHEENYLQNTSTRSDIVDSVMVQNQKISEGSQHRDKLVQNVKALREKIHSTRSRVLGGLSEMECKAKEFSPRYVQQQLKLQEQQQTKKPQKFFAEDEGNDGTEAAQQQRQQQQAGESRYPEQETRVSGFNHEIREDLIDTGAVTTTGDAHSNKSSNNNSNSNTTTPVRRRQSPFSEEKKSEELDLVSEEKGIRVYSAFV